MSNTKKIVQSAMFIALIGALLIINREMAYIFDYIVNILVSVIIVTYITQYDFKSGLMMSFGILVITFLFGSIYSYLYMPLSIIAGLTYAYALKKTDNYGAAILWTILVYVLGETLLACVVLPLLGYGDFNEFLTMTKELLSSFHLIVDDLMITKITKMAFVTAAGITGVFEAILIHLLVIIIFKKFKIKAIKGLDLSSLVLSKPLAYLCFLACFGFLFANFFINIDIIYYTIMIAATLGSTALFLEGAVYILTYGVFVKRRNYGIFLCLFIVLLFPYSIIILTLIGFLYASGPLMNYMNRKRGL